MKLLLFNLFQLLLKLRESDDLDFIIFFVVGYIVVLGEC